MQLLFEKTHPIDLVEALKLIHQTDESQSYTLSYYDKSIDDTEINQPVVFLFDYSKKGLDVTTEKLFEIGYRVFAFKTKKTDKLDFFKLSLTVLNIWPKVLEIIETSGSPFVYTYRYSGSRLVKAKE